MARLRACGSCEFRPSACHHHGIEPRSYPRPPPLPLGNTSATLPRSYDDGHISQLHKDRLIWGLRSFREELCPISPLHL
jgi:hypothetical protein